MALAVVLLLALFGTWALSQFWIDAAHEDVYCARLPQGFEGFCMAQISDLHAYRARGNERLLALLRAQAPDIIVITGDLWDKTAQLTQQDWLSSLCTALVAIAPTYYVTGNHEWQTRSQVQLGLDTLRACGITVLQNESVLLQRCGDTIALCGVDDQESYDNRISPRELRESLPNELFTILLAHRNDYAEDYVNYDLTLSGHAHGGMIRLPFTDGLVDHSGFFPTHTSGLYTIASGAQMFVSRGLGSSHRLPLRFLNRPHLPLLTLHSGA